MYDGMTFPEKPSTSFLRKAVNYFTGVSERELVIPNHEQVQEKCLHVYLENYRKLLTSLDLSKKKRVTYAMVVREIHTIFQQLRIQSLCQDNTPSDKHRIAEHLAKVRSVPHTVIILVVFIFVSKQFKWVDLHM